MTPRVALLTNIPTPYRLSFFRELNRRVSLHVVFDDRSEPNRQWALPPLDFPHSFTRGLRLRHVRKRRDLGMNDDRYVHLKLDLLPRLFRLRPEVVISGEFGARTLQAMIYGWLTRTPVIIWSEVTAHTETRTSRLKTMLRKAMVARASCFWSNGVESTGLLCEYGARREAVFPGMTGVDTGFFATETRRWLGERDRLRAELGVRGTTFLFVGQFIERKGLHLYLEALEVLAREVPRGWSAVFVGSGPLTPELEAWRSRHPEVPVSLTGFLQAAELPRYYALSDVFVMPTLEDNWSLVALEAAVSGLPQIFSRYNGCASDLSVGGETGCVIDPLHVGSFAEALKGYVLHPPSRLSDALSFRFLETYAPEQVAQRAEASVREALGSRGKRITWSKGALQ